MKKLAVILFLGCCALQCFAFDVLRPEQRSYVDTHRVVTQKDMTTIPGKIIIYYQRGGKPDGVATQDCYKVTAGVHKNPLMVKYISSTNLLTVISNQFVIAKGYLDDIKTKNKSAIEDLDDFATKHPLFKEIIEKIKAKIEIKFTAIEEWENSLKENIQNATK